MSNAKVLAAEEKEEVDESKEEQGKNDEEDEKDKKQAKPEEQCLISSKMITTTEQFPSWHPFKKRLHVELYKQFQKSRKQLFPEPEFDAKESIDNVLNGVYQQFVRALDLDLTYPFIKFFGTCLQFDQGVDYQAIYAENWEALISMPLFYVCQLITSFSARFMSLRTCQSNAKPKMFKFKMTTKHLIHLVYFKPPEHRKSFSLRTKQFMEEITDLVKSGFENFTEDKSTSIKQCLRNRNAFLLFFF